MRRYQLREVQAIVLHAGHHFMILKHGGYDLIHITRPGQNTAICRSHFNPGVVICDDDLALNSERIVCHHCLVALQSERERAIMAERLLS
jgi:hypothetical protein